MDDPILVSAAGVEFYVEVADRSGIGPVDLDDTFSFTGVRDTVAAIASSMSEAWERVKPDEARVEFSLKLVAKSGKLTGLLVEGGGEASLSVALTWKSPAASTQPGV